MFSFVHVFDRKIFILIPDSASQSPPSNSFSFFSSFISKTIPIPEEKYLELLRTRGSERLVLPKTASESDIAAYNTQYVYNRDYFVGDYVTVQHRRFGMMQP